MARLLLVLTLLAGSFLARAAAVEKLVSLEVNTGKIEGSLLIAGQSDAVALIIAGSGPTDRDGNGPNLNNNALKMLARGLSLQGISSLRYDKRGVAASQSAGLQEKDLRFEHYVNDARAWVDFLAKQNKFKQIVIIGHSEGSLIGMLAAQQHNVDKFISIAGVGQPIDKTIREQLKAQPPVVLAQAAPILDKLLQGQTVAEVPQFLYALLRPSVQPYMISWLKYDPQREVSKLQKPVLVVHGTTDIQVAVANADKLVSANKLAKKVLIQGMNHILKPAPLDSQLNFQTYNQGQLALQEGLVQAISEFVKPQVQHN